MPGGRFLRDGLTPVLRPSLCFVWAKLIDAPYQQPGQWMNGMLDNAPDTVDTGTRSTPGLR